MPPLVGLVASLIVAAAAFVGVVKSNRTNREAILATLSAVERGHTCPNLVGLIRNSRIAAR